MSVATDTLSRFVDVLATMLDDHETTAELTFAAHRRTLVCGALIEAGITDLGAGDPMRWVGEAA